MSKHKKKKKEMGKVAELPSDLLNAAYVKQIECSYKITETSDVPLNSVFFLSRFSFTNTHESQDCRGKGRAFL